MGSTVVHGPRCTQHRGYKSVETHRSVRLDVVYTRDKVNYTKSEHTVF